MLILGDPNGGCWPNQLQELLLKAALWDGEAAQSAYLEWLARGGMDHLDMGAYRLLPLVGVNLSRQGFDHPTMGTMRGLRRKIWYENRLLFARMAEIVGKVQSAGIPVMLLKGVPLVLKYYGDAGLRPMRDLDLLVRPEHALEAGRVFAAAGWSKQPLTRYRLGPDDLSFRQAQAYVDAEGREVDLHWHALYQATSPGVDDPFWEAAEPLEYEGLAVQSMCATDEVLHALVHGPNWNEIPPIRWVSDVLVVMRSAPVDWERVVRLAQRLRVSLTARAACEYLERVFQAPIPEWVTGRLASIRTGWAERLEYERTQGAPQPMGPWRLARSIYASYLRGAQGKGPLRQARELPRYTRFYLDAGSTGELWSRGARWMARKAGLPLTPYAARGVRAE